MTPYYERDGITIYHGDCRDILPSVVADVVITDPPYGINYDSTHSKFKNGIAREIGDWDEAGFDPAPILGTGLPSIVWGGNCFAGALPDFPGWLCWVKTARNGNRIRQAEMELAWTNFICRPQVFRHLWIGAFRDSESGARNYHPTQKPVALMKWCISLSPDGVVLDPYCGSGTTLLAAKDMRRGAIGIELDEGYCEVAAKRLEQGVLPK